MALAFRGLARYKSAMTRMGCRRTGIVALGGVLALLAGLVLRAGAAAPVNDNFADAIALSGLVNLTATNVGATAEPSEPAHADEPAARSLWWKWTPPFAGSFSIVTSNSVVTSRVQLDTTLAVYTGNALKNLVRVVANDDTDYGEFGATWSRAVFRAYPGETLMIAADSIGATGTIQLRISLAGPLADPWSVTDLQGQVVSSTDFSGQVVMVDFWETICGACVTELPDLIRVQNALHPRGFTFLGLSGDADVKTVTDYLTEQNVNYPIAMMNRSVQTILAGGQVGFPTKLLLDREGRIVGQYLGGHEEAYYRALVEPLLRSVPSVRVNLLALGSGGVRLLWPGLEPGYRVETTANPADGPWVDLGVPIGLMNNQYFVTVPAAQPAQFFRLIKP